MYRQEATRSGTSSIALAGRSRNAVRALPETRDRADRDNRGGPDSHGPRWLSPGSGPTVIAGDRGAGTRLGGTTRAGGAGLIKSSEPDCSTWGDTASLLVTSSATTARAVEAELPPMRRRSAVAPRRRRRDRRYSARRSLSSKVPPPEGTWALSVAQCASPRPPQCWHTEAGRSRPVLVVNPYRPAFSAASS